MNELQRALAEEQRRVRAALRDFVDGAASGDADRLWSSLEGLSYGEHDGGGWRRALQAVARLERVPSATRDCFLKIFLDGGDRIRQDTGDDLVLIDGLRVLLPPYEGPSTQLYRGESALNRRHRRYGASWSSLRDVALAYAEGARLRCSQGGSVLLVAHAPQAAIVCAPAMLGDDYGEQEYVVDRRHMKSVRVDARFAQLSCEEFDALRHERREALSAGT